MAGSSEGSTKMEVTKNPSKADLNKIADRLFTVRGLPIRYLVIPKCGCTYVKNVLWRLENGKAHVKPIRVHDDDDAFRRASDLGLMPNDISNEAHAFTVIRKPIDRFMSLYFDKVVGPGRKNYVPLAATLEEKYGLIPSPSSIEDHRENIKILIDWLGANLKTSVDLPKEAHWTPQVYRKNVMRSCNLKLLLVEDLTAHLRFLMKDIVPDIDIILGASEKNQSPKPAPNNELLTDQLRERINGVYAEDKRLYQRTRSAWSGIDLNQPDSAEVPRYLNVA